LISLRFFYGNENEVDFGKLKKEHALLVK
jgi:hypothetical protein